MDLIRGVMITGGCSRLRGLASIAEDVFEIPVELTRARNVSGATQIFEDPRFSTAIGLTKYARIITRNMRRETVLDRIARRFGGLGGILGRRGR